MRLFIAIDLEGQGNYLKELQGMLPSDLGRLKPSGSFHLTLKFLGDVFEEDVEKIRQALRNIRSSPFKMKLKEIGFFPSASFIKVVWAGFEEQKELIRLQKDIEKALEDFNIRQDFEFVPHVTLARVKFARDGFKEEVKKIKVRKKEFSVDSFKLIKSTLTREGPVYEVVEEFSI